MAITINGSAGTITGLSAGGLPTGSVTADSLATNSVDSAELIDGAVDNSHLATGVDAGKLINALPAISGASLTSLPATGNSPRFACSCNDTNQSLTASTWTKNTWISSYIDTDSGWDSTNHKYTIPTGEGGDYYFEGQCTFYSSSNAMRYVKLAFYVNGSVYQWGYTSGFHTSDQAWRHAHIRNSTVATLSAGDYVEVYVHAEVFTGSVSVLQTGSGKKFINFAGWKLS